MFDYYHEDTDQLEGANVYNGQNSVLWVNFREAFADEIKETYQNLRNNKKITFEKLEERFITNGSDKWSESIYNEDTDFKYVTMLKSDNDATNLPQVRGSGEEHFRYFIENRLNFCDSKWYASDYANDYISLRIYTPNTWAGVEPNPAITVKPFSTMYAGVRYKANGTLYQKLVTSGEEETFAPKGETFESENNETFNDTETAVYGAHQLSSIGDLAPLYCGSVNVSNADKLIELKVGDGTEGYSNANLHELSVGTNKLLKKIDIQNCPNFTSVLDVSNCPSIEEVYAKGSSITSVNFPDAGLLRIAQLPATVTNFTLKHQLYVEELTFEGYSSIKTLCVENCPTIDVATLLANCVNVERVRLTDVNWTFDGPEEMITLGERPLAGLDENGVNIDKMWIDGKCHIKALTGEQFASIKAAFPYMTITYDALTTQLIFMSEDGNTELTRQTISNGGNGIDPVTAGTINKPTKTSTAQYNYTFAGWSKTPGGAADSTALNKVEANRTVYAAFSSAIRSYTVRFYNGTTLLQTSTVEYGKNATYTGSTPVNNTTGNPADFEFRGWSPEPTNIKGNTDCYAQYYDKREITDSWGTIIAAVNDGTAATKYSVGAFKTMNIGEVELPYNFYGGSSVVYNNEIHILGGTNAYGPHYKWDGSNWISLGKITIEPRSCPVVVYNDEIHILYSTAHYKWNGTSWTSVSTLPYRFFEGSAVMYNNEIHMLGSSETGNTTKHYKWDGTSWVEVSTLPYTMYEGEAVVFNNEIHILGSGNVNRTKHYKWNGTEWSSVSTLPYEFSNGSAVVYNNEIHILGTEYTRTGNYVESKYHYKWDGIEWIQVSTLPYKFYKGSAFVYDDKIHIIGSYDSSNYKSHYIYSSDTNTWTPNGVTESIPMQIAGINHDELASGVKWERLVNPPSPPQYGCAVTYRNEVHALGGTASASYTQHIKWDATNSTWVTVSTLPYQFRSGCAVVLNDEIHIMGSYQTTNKTEHYKWNPTDGWVSASTLPHQFYCSSAVVLNNEIHILGSYVSSYRKYHYKWNGIEWVSVSTLPYNFYYGSAVVYNGEIHIFISTAHYKWDGSAWTSVSTLPYDLKYGVAAIYNDEIHIFGGSGKETAHYKWTGTEWVSVSTLPGNFTNYPLTVCDGIPYLFVSTSFYMLNTDHPKATLTFIAKNVLEESRSFHSTKTQKWSTCDLRSYLNSEEFIASLPSALQTSIKSVNKITDSDEYGQFENVLDRVWIPSYTEVNSANYTNLFTQGQGEPYSIFTDGPSRARTTTDGVNVRYWIRSRAIKSDGSKSNAIVTSAGIISYSASSAYSSGYYVLIGFCL